MEAARLRTIYTPLFFWLPSISQLVILAYGGWLVIEGHISAGEFVAFFQYLNMLVFPVQSLGEMVPSGPARDHGRRRASGTSSASGRR